MNAAASSLAVADRDLFEKLSSRTVVADSTGCWEWTGSLDPDGYARVSHEGENRKVSRLMWKAVHGELPPDGLFVLHRCDNRKCIYPEHLFSGTNADNMADMVSKGRHSWGDAAKAAKCIEAANTPGSRLCRQCGSPFIPRRSWAVFCSTACRNAFDQEFGTLGKVARVSRLKSGVSVTLHFTGPAAERALNLELGAPARITRRP